VKGPTVADALLRDELVEIPKNRERQFGCSGKMLKPSRKSVEALVRKIPRGEIATIALLRQALADKHGAQTTCPFLTKRALLAIAKDPAANAPYWRVVVARGEMIDAYPGGASAQAKRLKAEGIGIRTNRVADLPGRLATL
jgi:alkylated DNA nucleotide flippase Atl1